MEEPVAWPNTTLVRGDAVEAVRAVEAEGDGLLSTLGSLSLCRSLLRAGLVHRFEDRPRVLDHPPPAAGA